jgi:hypothetical protein
MNSLHLNLCPNGLTRKLGTSARFYLLPLPPSKPSRPQENRFVVRGSQFIVKPKDNTTEKSKNQQKMTDGENVRSPQSTAKSETKKIKAMINDE